MKCSLPHRFDPDAFPPDDAENLLDADRRRARSDDPLARLLAVAAAPARRDELAGEQEVLAAFRAAHPGAGPVRWRSVVVAVTTQLVKLKIAAVAAFITALGAVALAATTGTLPMPGTSRAPGHTVVAPRQGRDPRPLPPPSSTQRPSVLNGSPPSLLEQCQAYRTTSESDRARALESPAFRALVAAAGGAPAVDTYCASLLISPPPIASPTGSPPLSPTGQPVDPTGTPATSAQASPSTSGPTSPPPDDPSAESGADPDAPPSSPQAA